AQLDADLLVVVHADQLDHWQARALVAALAEGAHLALVGDPRALPPLGPGWPWADLALQAADVALAARPGASTAALVGAAECIARGDPLSHLVESDDLWLCPADDPEEIVDTVGEIVCERLPRQRGVTAEAVAVLCLARHGPAGAAALNAALRARRDAGGGSAAAVRAAGRSFRPGERAILAESVPHLALARGTLVRVVGPARPPGVVHITLPDRRQVALDEADAAALDYAAALEVRQAQGGPFRAVVVPMLSEDYVTLHRRALYSAVSSAREVCVLVGQERALAHALASAREPLRYRRLAARLGPPPPRPA
ncbi:MAG: ATP-binding domain-containing protein, partial [Chloroflexi bacterium]|nr:ATP-binding domain-containing protein [Chloroflexota bacterium]